MATPAAAAPPPAPPKSKATSCGPCRRSKTKCDKRFPCSRCIRLRIACEDPFGKVREETAVEDVLTMTALFPTLASAPSAKLCLGRYGPKHIVNEKGMAVLTVLASLYRGEGYSRPRILDAITSMAKALGHPDAVPWTRTLSESEAVAEQQRLAQTFPALAGQLGVEHGVRAEQAVHPYAWELFQDPFLAMATVACGGQERVYVNKGWSHCFHNESDMFAHMSTGSMRAAEIFGTVVHPDDRAFVIPMLDNCLFGSSDSLCESAHVLRCRAPRAANTFLALARFRTVVMPEGYLCAVFSLQVLPLPAEMIRVSLPFQGLVSGRNPWQDYLSKQEYGRGGYPLHPLEDDIGRLSVGSGGIGRRRTSGRRPRNSIKKQENEISMRTLEEDEYEEDDEEDEVEDDEEGEDDEGVEEDDDVGRESFRSDGVGRDSLRPSDAMSETEERPSLVMAAASLANLSAALDAQRQQPPPAQQQQQQQHHQQQQQHQQQQHHHHQEYPPHIPPHFPQPPMQPNPPQHHLQHYQHHQQQYLPPHPQHMTTPQALLNQQPMPIPTMPVAATNGNGAAAATQQKKNAGASGHNKFSSFFFSFNKKDT